jgi:hypothetical protein
LVQQRTVFWQTWHFFCTGARKLAELPAFNGLPSTPGEVGLVGPPSDLPNNNSELRI